jgi:hypothetical protein
MLMSHCSSLRLIALQPDQTPGSPVNCEPFECEMASAAEGSGPHFLSSMMTSSTTAVRRGLRTIVRVSDAAEMVNTIHQLRPTLSTARIFGCNIQPTPRDHPLSTRHGGGKHGKCTQRKTSRPGAARRPAATRLPPGTTHPGSGPPALHQQASAEAHLCLSLLIVLRKTYSSTPCLTPVCRS